MYQSALLDVAGSVTPDRVPFVHRAALRITSAIATTGVGAALVLGILFGHPGTSAAATLAHHAPMKFHVPPAVHIVPDVHIAPLKFHMPPAVHIDPDGSEVHI